MNRRDVFKYIAQLTAINVGSRILVPLQAWGNDLAQTTEAQFFVFIRVHGGMDATLGLDPQVHSSETSQEDMFIEYRENDIFKKDSIKLGPAMKSLYSYADDLIAINGIMMNTADNGHESSMSFISTGDGSGKAPDISVEIATACHNGPLGVIFGGSIKPSDRTTTLTNFVQVEKYAASLNNKEISSFLEQVSGDSSFLNETILLLQKRENFALFSKHYQDLTQQFSDSSDPLPAAKIIAASLFSGLSFQGQIEFNAGLDSHSDHEGRHLANQTSVWNQVRAIFDMFKSLEYGNGTSLFDKTIFLVASEFSRTPFLNSNKGKDHNPLTNSVLVAGGGIRGGRSIGQSHLITREQSLWGISSHVARPINFSTLEVATSKSQAESSDFQFITPDRVIASIATKLSADPSKFKSASLRGPLLKL